MYMMLTDEQPNPKLCCNLGLGWHTILTEISGICLILAAVLQPRLDSPLCAQSSTKVHFDPSVFGDLSDTQTNEARAVCDVRRVTEQ